MSTLDIISGLRVLREQLALATPTPVKSLEVLQSAAAELMLAAARESLTGQGHVDGGYQAQVYDWTIACFGEEITRDRTERNHRFLEEALELVQAGGCTASEAHQLVDYVFGRDVGDPFQELGGVMVTLAALATANGFNMDAAGAHELARCWTKVEQIRAKQAAKPKHSPLPGATAPAQPKA